MSQIPTLTPSLSKEIVELSLDNKENLEVNDDENMSVNANEIKYSSTLESEVNSRLTIYREKLQHELALDILLDECCNLPRAEEYILELFNETNTSKSETVPENIDINATKVLEEEEELKIANCNCLEENKFLTKYELVEKRREDAIEYLFVKLLQSKDKPPRVNDAVMAITHLQPNLSPWYEWSKIVKLFPNHTPLNKLGRLLKHTITKNSMTINEKELESLLLKSEYLSQYCTLSKKQSVNVTIDHTNCAICNKQIRIGSVFVLYPDNTVAHELCAQNNQISPKSNYNFRTSPLTLLHEHLEKSSFFT